MIQRKGLASLVGAVLVGLSGFGACVQRADATMVTFTFEGEIENIGDEFNRLGDSVVVGTPFSVTYTFDSTTADNQPVDTTFGQYFGSVTSLTGNIGPHGIVGNVPMDIFVHNDTTPMPFQDSYAILGTAQMLGLPLTFTAGFSDNSNLILSSDALPVVPFSLDSMAFTSFSVSSELLGLNVEGPVLSLVPEPTSLCLLGLGAAVLFRRGRKRRGARAHMDGWPMALAVGDTNCETV